MKNYERPMILEVEEMAEGVYANSGVVDYDNDTECWTWNVYFPDPNKNSNGAGTECHVRIRAEHPTTIHHISAKQTITITFNQAITGGSFDSGTFVADGTTVTCVRELLADAYKSGDNFDADITIKCGDSVGLEVVASTIACTHAVNVQGNFD